MLFLSTIVIIIIQMLNSFQSVNIPLQLTILSQISWSVFERFLLWNVTCSPSSEDDLCSVGHLSATCRTTHTVWKKRSICKIHSTKTDWTCKSSIFKYFWLYVETDMNWRDYIFFFPIWKVSSGTTSNAMTYNMQKTDDRHTRRQMVAVRGGKVCNHTVQSHLYSDAVTTMSDQMRGQ